MARKFEIPDYYRSSVISTVKQARRIQDQRKKDFTPSVLDLGKIRFKIARHFGLCFGVENAIEIAYRAVKENPDKRVFLLSEMIHNPHVNNDLREKGVRFILNTDGTQLIPFSELKSEDIVIVPAFGTTVELFAKLEALGINPLLYNATCPFVEKVWKRASQLGDEGYSIVIHGKHNHEETRATFSHARLSAPSVVVRDLDAAKQLAAYIRGDKTVEQFYEDFKGRHSDDFNPEKHLERIGVVNQTTMLATETQAISNFLRKEIESKYGSEKLSYHFANTRDTLCYATSENQDSIYALIENGGDLAIVVGGYNSSNTSHLVELCEERLPTFYIKDADEIVSDSRINHLCLKTHTVVSTENWIPERTEPIEILLSAGASCPDSLVDDVIVRLSSLFNLENSIATALKPFVNSIESEPLPIHA